MKPLGKRSINIDEDLAKEIAMEKVNTGLHLHVLIKQAWDQYKRGGHAGGRSTVRTADQTSIELSEKETLWITNLLRILRSGNQAAITAVTENLKVFTDYVRIAEGARDREDAASSDLDRGRTEVSRRSGRAHPDARTTVLGQAPEPAPKAAGAGKKRKPAS